MLNKSFKMIKYLITNKLQKTKTEMDSKHFQYRQTYNLKTIDLSSEYSN